MEATTTSGWASQTSGEKLFTLTIFGLSTAATAAFAYYLFTDPSRLNDVWMWSRSLPLLVQGVLWLLCLPWMLALLMWVMPWALPIRMVLVVSMLAFTEFLVWPWK